MVTISPKEAADKLGLTPRRVMGLCAQGSLEGAFKEGRLWRIPLSSLDKYMGKLQQNTNILPCPVGNTSYIEVCQNCYYIDKTLLIKSILDEQNKVILFARPRRFGKTLTMDMLKTFFEKSKEDTSVYFQNRKIWNEGSKYTIHQGKYPTIFLSFKDVKQNNWSDTLESIQLVLKDEYKRHQELADSPYLDDDDKFFYKQVLEQKLSKIEYMKALKWLSDMLYRHYKEKTIIIIDEYDTPIQHGYSRGFYDETIDFLKNFFSAALKDNHSLERGFLTGILRVSKENLFSDLNNITVNTVTDNRFSEYFGFTDNEVKEASQYYQLENKYEEIKEWYDGYRFGSTDIYNPWSVTSYFSSGCEASPYWANTSSNEIIKETLMNADDSVISDLRDLMLGKEIIVRIDTRIIYPMLKSRKDAIYTFLLLTGYLKIVRKIDSDFYSLALPNKEIRSIYQQEILSWLAEKSAVNNNVSDNICRALITNNVELLQKSISSFLKASASYLDTASESFYHGLILAFCATAADRYIIRSNREAGYGRFDIQLEPINAASPAIILEFKTAENEKELQAKAEAALMQISSKEYCADLKDKGYKNILCYGIAFAGKELVSVAEIV